MWNRGSRIIPFILHLFGRPLQEDESLQRDDILSIKKLLAEATPAEHQTILGWIIDTRRLLIQLPENKFLAWTHAIDEILAKKGVKHSDIEASCRLNHAGFIIPMSRHFLGRLRRALYVTVHCPVTLKPDQRADLLLWKDFLLKAHSGISLNLLTYRLPTHIGRSDACEHGIGGFSVTTGVAWRWEIPLHLRWRATLNSLEFLAAYVQLCMDIEVGKAPPGSCFLSQTDSTSTAGWLRKSNFDDAEPLHLELARATATMIMGHESCLYSQWFAGNENDVADSLSRDHHLSDAALLALLLSSVPEQVPKDFRLCPIPPDVDSKITTWLLSLPPSTQSPMAPHRSKLATGDTGTTTSSPLNWMTIHSSPPSPGARSTISLQVSEPAVRANDVQDKPSSKGTPPVSSTIRATFDAVAQAYWANDIPSPIHDADGKLAFILQRVVKGYANTDPSEKHQKAITSRVVRLVTRLRNAANDSDDEDTACGQLCGGAWFFAM